ncbi:MAG: diaminopimelate aminotransferase, partial [Deltaproteobacteria bacterium]
IVVPDGGNETGSMIEVAEKSMLWVRFTVLGRQCHASTPHKGRNSLAAAARLIVALEKIKREFSEGDELFSPPISTFEPTKIEANVENVNTIPGKDVFYMDCRILPRFEVDRILERCQEIAGEISNSTGVKIKADIAYREEAAPPTPSDAPVVEALSRAIHLVTGREAKPMGIGGGTVAAFFRKAGLPAAVWCTSPDTAHQPNEYCLIPDILTDAKVFATMAMV